MFTFILFNTSAEGMFVYSRLLEEKLDITIAPTPREASKCCGVAVLIRKDSHVPIARQIIEDENLPILSWYVREDGYNTKRDKYL